MQKPDVVRKWCDWFGAIYCKNHGEVPEPGKAVRTLVGSFDSFRQQYEAGLIQSVRQPIYRYIYTHLQHIYTGGHFLRTIREAAMIYGLPVAYGYYAVMHGKAAASDKFGLVLYRLSDNIQGEAVQKQLRDMAEQTAMHGGLRGPIKDDEKIFSLIDGLMSSAGIPWPPENPTLVQGSQHVWDIIESRVRA
jgi:hypothetical protein